MTCATRCSCLSSAPREARHRFRILLACWIVLLGFTLALPAQVPQIAAFGNGLLTWSNAPGLHAFTVLWSPYAVGPWADDWDGLDGLVTTNVQTTAAVPMFYRVSQAFTPAAMQGVWLLLEPTQGDIHFIAQEDGVISESALFVKRAPSGCYTVGETGDVHITFVLHDVVIALDGCFESADRIRVDPPYNAAVIRRVQDTSRCMGVWTGSLFETSNPFGVPRRDIAFVVDARGLVTNITGFAGNNIGRLFALTDGSACGFFYTDGLDADNDDPYDLFRINGTLSGDTIVGTYEADDPGFWGSLTFGRQ